MVKKRNRNKSIYIITIITALLLYSAGVISGLYANKVLERKVNRDIYLLQEYVNIVKTNIENLQLEESFLRLVGEKDSCKALEWNMDNIRQELSLFWRKLPYRIEAYDQSIKNPSEEYLALKKSYAYISLKAWIIASESFNNCNTTIIPLLYFYSKNCSQCVSQGQVLDEFKTMVQKQGSELMVFTIDKDVELPALNLVLKYYNIKNTPALIVDDQVLQGRLFSVNELNNTVQKALMDKYLERMLEKQSLS